MLQKTAKDLKAKYGWNIVPMYYLQRNEDGSKKAKMIEWQKYKSEEYDLDNWNDSYTSLMVMTGKISNLTILDIDSDEALDTILNSLNCELEDLSNYIVRTSKGYQLFYEYEPNLKTRIGIKDKIDFLNGGVSFALDTNEGYTTIKNGMPDKMPETLKGIIIDNEIQKDSERVKSFESALRENSTIVYLNPLHYIIKDFVEASRIGSKLKSNLEKVFCTKDYKNWSLSDFGKEGVKHNSWMYVGAIVASNPTIDEDLYIRFMEKWAEKIVHIDLSDNEQKSRLLGRIKGNMQYFRYNEDWKQKSEELKNPSTLNVDRKMWYDPEEDRYVIYEPSKALIMRMSKIAFKDEVAREFNKTVDGDNRISGSDVDVTLIDRVFETFDPTIEDEFFTNDHGVHMHNNFKRTELLKHFLICEPKTKIPQLIKNIIYHAYPIKEERENFLHALAYHMTYLQAAPTMFVLTGKSGTGKNTLFEYILKGIYGDMHLRTSGDSLTGRFRNNMINKLLVFIDEVNERNAHAKERGSIHNVLKQIVANSTLSIESKGVDEKIYPNHALYVMASNKDIPFKLEEGFDRRINISKTKDDNIMNLNWFPDGDNELFDMIDEELPDFVAYLASIELDSKRSRVIIKNPQLEALIDTSVSRLDKMIDCLYPNLDLEPMFELDHDFAEWLEQNLIKDDKQSVSVKDFKDKAGDIGPKLIKSLKSVGVPYKTLKINGQQIRSLILNPSGSNEVFKTKPNINI